MCWQGEEEDRMSSYALEWERTEGVGERERTARGTNQIGNHIVKRERADSVCISFTNLIYFSIVTGGA